MNGVDLPASPPYILSGKPSLSLELDFDFEPLKATAAVSFRLESRVRTMSRGTPGFTSAAFIYSVPKSMPITAEETADAVETKRTSKESRIDRLESRRRPCGGI